MEKYDTELEARVWKRVRGEAEECPCPLELQPLAAAEWAEAAMYLMLSRQMQGSRKGLLRQLFEQERAHADCLKGMHQMMTGKPLSLRTPPPSVQMPEQALRKCYANTLRRLGEYEKRSDDPQYGHVFQKMAEEEKQHCRMLLELVGSMKG